MEQITRKKRLGDRKEGRRLRSLDAIYSFVPFIMKTRGDASNYFSASFDVAAAEKYIRMKRDNGFKGFGILHIIIASFIRTASQYPGINRFVSGKRVFARDCIEIVMTIKKKMSSESGEAEFKVKFQPTDTIDTVYEKISEAVEKIRNDVEPSTEKVASFLCKLPRPFLSFAIGVIEWFDYHGWLPMSLLDASPFHGSLVITDLGSLGIPPVFHHLYNFGNAPVFIAFGAKRRAYELDAEGQVVEKKYLDYTAVTDERICDGYYFAMAFKYMNYCLRNPDVLDEAPDKVIEDVD